MEITPEKMTELLKEAEAAHAEFEKSLGKPDEDWPAWYAKFIVAKIREEAGDGKHLGL